METTSASESLRVLESLVQAEAVVRRRLAVELERKGVSATGFAILTLVEEEGGEAHLRDVRERLRLSKANATEVVSTLEQRGLLQRRRLDNDRRAASLSLTDDGRALVAKLAPEHGARVEEAFSALEPAERAELAALCTKLAA